MIKVREKKLLRLVLMFSNIYKLLTSFLISLSYFLMFYNPTKLYDAIILSYIIVLTHDNTEKHFIKTFKA